MNSIRTRLMVFFMVVIVITVISLEILLIYTVRQNFYGSMESSLTSQIRISADLYAKYFADATLEENVLYNVDVFWKQTNAQVEIIDKDGNIIMDSIGAIPPADASRDDIDAALKGERGKWIGEQDNEQIMAIAYPLRANGEIIGALRFITTLREVNTDIRRIADIFIAIGIAVLVIVGGISIFLANTIVIPLREVTKTALTMAQGNFHARSKKRQADEIGKLSDTLNYMAEEIVKKDQLKNEFISSVSHELRTPLTSIMGWAITLQNDNFQNKEMLNDGLGIIAKESERLTLMVEDLLDFSKFVSSQVKLQMQPIDLSRLMEHIRKQLTPRATRENIRFSVSSPGDLPAMITDGNRLKQLFLNVLDNAFNFSPPGGEVSLTVEGRNGQFLFLVQDKGCGIAPDELPRVKEKFYKGKTSRSKNGIGLSICQEIVDLMGGRLEITSELNKGTEVYLVIPQGVESTAPAGPKGVDANG